MGNRLENKVAVITGGASGIGRRTAERFVAEGAKVVIGDRNGELLAEVEASLGSACTTLMTDVTAEAEVESLIARAVAAFGRIDAAVNCAGFGTYSPLPDHPADTWQAVIDVCLTGTFYSVKHETRQLIAQGGGGAVVNIASISGRQPGEGM